MLYSAVVIKYDLEGELKIYFSDLYGEREEGKGTISALGFYHYPRHMGKKIAFEKLKNTMVKNFSSEIDKLNYKIDQLEKLNLEE